MSMRSFVVLTVLAALPLVACTPVATTQGTPALTPSETAQVDTNITPAVPLLPPSVLAVQQSLASALGLPVDEVTLIEATPVDWPDSCLGAAQADEMCAEVITPGYRLVFDTLQGRYVIHSDQTGSTYRQVTPALGGTPVPEVTEVPILPTREAPAPGSSGIEGQVLIGPACPGPVSIESPCPDQPFPATLTILTAQGERVGQVTTDEAGRFRVALPVGQYIIHPEPSKGGIAYALDQSVTVVEGEFASVQVVYDSGVR